MALTNGTSSTVAIGATAPGQQDAVTPVLQAQDGSFVGTVGTYNGSFVESMIAFDSSGNVRWTVPNEQPQIATDDGGVIGQSGTIYDQAGNATGQTAPLPIYSWNGNAYQQQGSVEQVNDDLLFVRYDLASGFWPIVGGNYSSNEAGYALVRTFQDNVVNANVFVANPSQTNPNQQTITNVLNDILQALNSGRYGSCSAWLTGASPGTVSGYINTVITGQLYGHGTFNDIGTAAFVGISNQDKTRTGVPVGWNITVNDQGAFFNAKLDDKTFTVGRRAYKGGTLKAQAAILIHELGHLMNEVGGAGDFQPEQGTSRRDVLTISSSTRSAVR